jgi:hypothetical protein
MASFTSPLHPPQKKIPGLQKTKEFLTYLNNHPHKRKTLHNTIN